MTPRRVTLADVARRAGVSPTTASFVLSGRGEEMRISREAEQRVVESANELEYRTNIVSVSLRTGTTRTVGFVSETVATSRFAGDLIKGSLEAARERGFHLFIGETEDDAALERSLIDAMHDRQVDGIVLASMYTRAVTVPQTLAKAPAVLLNAVPRQACAIPAVIPDELQAGRTAAQALLDAGHRQGIHLIGAGPTLRRIPVGGFAARERLTAIRETLAEAGVPIAGGRLCDGWEPENGYAATRSILEEGRPGALVCFNDRLALGAYDALRAAGLGIPDDVSVISFDDDVIASWLRPKLTSVALPHYELGRKAIDVLLEEIDRTGPGEKGRVHRIPMPLRARGSVGPPAR